MESQDSAAGLGHLAKNALPLVGRIGAVTGGIFSLLAVFKTISGEIVIAIEGLLLLMAIVASVVVVWNKTGQVIDDKAVAVPTYPKSHRMIAAIVLGISSILMIVFLLRTGMDLLNKQERNRVAETTRSSPRNVQTLTLERPARQSTIAALVATVTAVRSSPTLIVNSATPANPPTSAPPPINQMTDVNALNRIGQEAISSNDYRMALNAFNRALQIEATNAQAQFGLGVGFYLLNDYASAIKPLQTSLQLNPSLSNAHAYLGFSYDHRDDFVKAKVEYEEYLKVAPNNAPLRSTIQERLKRLSSPAPYPSLTPNMTPTPTPAATQATP